MGSGGYYARSPLHSVPQYPWADPGVSIKDFHLPASEKKKKKRIITIFKNHPLRVKSISETVYHKNIKPVSLVKVSTKTNLAYNNNF